jgi:choline dehydrogenase
MMYHHCAPSDFDEWSRLGATGWAYKDLAPYFRKSEKFTPHVLYPDIKEEEHGDSGLWQTGYPYAGVMTGLFVKACAAVGIPTNP